MQALIRGPLSIQQVRKESAEMNATADHFQGIVRPWQTMVNET